ncbi:hypothetical protein ACOMHN_009215 [Nucella lapillus]
MEYYKVFFSFFLSFFCSALDISIYGDSNLVIRPGGSRNLTCHLTMGLEVILNYKIYWIHVSHIGKEVILSEQQTLRPGIDDSRFKVKVSYVGATTNVSLAISNALPSYDGRFLCRADPTQGGDPLKAEVTVLIPNDVQSLTLTFDGEQTSTESDVAVQREEGKFPVTCQAAGFNPRAQVELFLGDQPLQAGEPLVSVDVPAQEDAGAPRYQASVSIEKLQLAAGNSGKTLRCKATASFDGASPVMASMPLTIIALEPEIVCQTNASGLPGNRYVSLTCRVQHQRVTLDHYSFEIGYTGEIVTAVNDSASHDRLVVKPVEGLEKTDDVTLILYEVNMQHFNSYYYLDVFLHDGQRFRETAKLVLKDDIGAATKPAAYSLCLLLLSLFVWSL